MFGKWQLKLSIVRIAEFKVRPIGVYVLGEIRALNDPEIKERLAVFVFKPGGEIWKESANLSLNTER